MASLPYPLNRLYTHIVSVIATTQSACILMSVWVWQGCHTLLQIPILLFLKNLFFCSSVFSKTTCSHVLLSFQTTTCSHVLMSSKQKPVLLFFCLFKQQHVLMSSCLQNKNLFFCSSVFSNNNMFSCPQNKNMSSCSLVFQKQHVLLSFPQKEPYPPSNPVFMSPKKTAESNAPSR